MFFPTLDEDGNALLDEFELRLRSDVGTDLADFLLPPGHPQHIAELIELVRLDMEYAWGRGSPRSPQVYFDRFPVLRENRSATAALAFEDYRQRRLGGEPVVPEQYAERYSISVTGWPIDPEADREPADPFADVARSTPPPSKFVEQFRKPPAAQLDDEHQPTQVLRIAPARPGLLPEIGSRFLGFELLEELGRGAFGRVYLARQGALAARPVALKVARGLFNESQTLAQLQHTNIVPIYSAHEAEQVQVLCMPYFGRCTLAQVISGIRDRGGIPDSGEFLVGSVLLGNTVSSPEAKTDIPSSPEDASRVLFPSEEAQPSVRRDRSIGDQAWVKLSTMSYTNAVVWVGSQLTAGLAHAHERGILHRDLKPANILLTDDGVPMLLDFNIAEDTKTRGFIRREVTGGTLPYMSPEQLEAYAGADVMLDARADLYALGVILFEMLAGTRPFPDRLGETEPMIAQMIEDRKGGPPRLRERNSQVSPSIEAMVLKCLATNPADRYASARELHEDLTRQLENRPLRFVPEPSLAERIGKWKRRHPRISSSASVAAIAVLLLTISIGAGVAIRERSRSLEARVALSEHARDLTALQSLLDDRNQTRESLNHGIELCRLALERYSMSADSDGVPRDWDQPRLLRYLPAENRAQLRDDFGEVFYLMAKAASRQAELATDPDERESRLAEAARWNRLAEGYAPDRIPRAVLEQRADLHRLAGQEAEATRWAEEAQQTPTGSARDRYLLGYWHHHRGRYRVASAELVAATDADPANFSAWFVRGVNHLALEQNDLAAMCFTACIALRADFSPVWVNRGIAFGRLRKFDHALADYATASRLNPGSADLHILRGGMFQAQGKPREAADAFSAALNAPECPSRVYFYRANSRRQCGDAKGAAADEAEGLKREPTDELSWTARAETRLAHNDPRAALDDVRGALRVNPLSLPALQLQAHLLSEHLGDAPGAVKSLDRAVESYPDSAPARAGRGVLLARTGDRERSLRDAEAALQLDSGPSNLYQVGCIYALTARKHPADRFRAFELIAAALRAGFGREYIPSDPDLDAIRKYPEFEQLRTLR